MSAKVITAIAIQLLTNRHTIYYISRIEPLFPTYDYYANRALEPTYF